MRRVVRNYNRKPKILKQANTMVTWNNIAITANASLIDQKLYFDPYVTSNGNRSRVLDKLEIWYYGKCAYCERRYKLDVEHFRPKGRITDENGQIINATGYYWLCYEWSNLLPSCISCNREGGKMDKFPIIGVRVAVPSIRNGSLNRSSCLVNKPKFIAEIPYLLNPEIDNPANFFSFKISDNGKGIEIYGTDAGNRGNFTQRICKLNRYEIRIERAQIILDFVEAINSLFKLHQIGNRNQQQLEQGVENCIQNLYDKAKNHEFTHTLLRQFIVQSTVYFQSIVLPFLPQKLRGIISQAFLRYVPV
jgi:hypothetical protein